MSDDNVNLQESEEQVVEDALIETGGAPEGEESEALTQGAAEDQGQDLIDLESMTLGTQTPKEESDKHEMNRAHAAMRIKQKAAKQKLEDNKFTPADADAKKPKRVDFLNQTRIYDEFDGDSELARAAYEDALDDYNEQAKSSVATQRKDTQAEHDYLESLSNVEDAFEANAKAVSGRVAGFEVKVSKANDYLGYENAMAIKQNYPQAAPLMLAMLGSSKELSNKIVGYANAGNQAAAFRELAKLELQATKAMTPAKTLSTAPEEVAVAGETSSITSLEKAMDDAANDPKKFDEYMRIKKQLKTLKGQRYTYIKGWTYVYSNVAR